MHARVAGYYALALGLVGVAGRLSGHVFGPNFPPTLSHANLAASLLEIGLVVGLLRARRGAWAFAVMAALMASVMNVFAWPSFRELGVSASMPSILVSVARLGFLFTLLWAADAYRRTAQTA